MAQAINRADISPNEIQVRLVIISLSPFYSGASLCNQNGFKIIISQRIILDNKR